jgi:hypothetical protein
MGINFRGLTGNHARVALEFVLNQLRTPIGGSKTMPYRFNS